MTETDKYVEQSLRYMQNALSSLARHDYDKASEFLWGSAAQAVKAVAASRGMNLRSHGELWDFTRELSRDLAEPQIYEAFRTANYLHSNFYEVKLRPEEILEATDAVREFVARLLSLAGYRPS